LHDVHYETVSTGFSTIFGETCHYRCSHRQYNKACRACSVNRSKPSMRTMIARAEGVVKNVKRCEGSVVGAEAYKWVLEL